MSHRELLYSNNPTSPVPFDLFLWSHLLPEVFQISCLFMDIEIKKRKEKDCVLELIMHIPYKQGQLMEAYKTEYIIITDPVTLSITCLIIAFIVYKVASA